MNLFDRSIDVSGSEYNLFRDGTFISKIKALRGESGDLSLSKSTVIKVGDIIEDLNTNLRYKITDFREVKTPYGVAGLRASIELVDESSNANSTFTVHNYGNAIIGNQQNANINIGTSLEYIENLIQRANPEDQELLNEFLEQLKLLDEGKTSIRKGGFSVFMETLNKYAPLLSAVSGFLIRVVGGG